MIEFNNENVNLYDIPVSALNLSRFIITIQLDAPHILKTEDGIERDWQGLVTLARICPQAIPAIINKSSPTEEVFKIWKDNSIGLLLEYLEKMERCDIIEEIEEKLDKDVKSFMKLQKKANISSPHLVDEIDQSILTVEDVIRVENGLGPQNYDAFVLYSDEDSDFVVELLRRMEDDNKFKLCLKDRDLIGGITFEHDAIMRLIAERCNRLIIIISNNFLKSEANNFFVNFAQWLGIAKGRRKIIPCLIEKCKIPYNLSFVFIIDYTRSGKFWDFWDKLRDALRTTSSQISYHSSVSLESLTINTPLAITDRTNISIPNMQDDIPQSSNNTLYKNNAKKETSKVLVPISSTNSLCEINADNVTSETSKEIKKSDFKVILKSRRFKWFKKPKSKKAIPISTS